MMMMNTFYLKIRKSIDRLTLSLVFICIAFFTNALYFKTGSIEGAHDLVFHFQRVHNLVENINRLHFNPLLNTYSFNQFGSAVASCYPNLVTYLFAILIIILKNQVLAYQSLMILTNLIVLVNTYISFNLVFVGKKKEAFLTSVAYSSCSLVGYYQYVSGDLSAVWGMGFLPLASAGLYHLVKNNRYRLLAFSMSTIFLCHLLSFIIISFTFGLVVLINYDRLNGTLFISLLKAIGITILVTSIFWIKTLVILLSTKLYVPGDIGLLYPIDLKTLYHSIKSFSYNWNLSIVAIMGIVAGIISFKILSNVLRSCLIASLMIIFFCTGFMPWDFFAKTPIAIIQWVNRLMIFPELTGCVLFSVIILKIFSNKLAKANKIVFVLSIFLLLGLNYKLQRNLYGYFQTDSYVTTEHDATHSLRWTEPINSYKLKNNDQVENILRYQDISDYTPSKTISVYLKIQYPDHNAIFNNSASFKVHTTPIPDGAIMKFNANKSYKNVELPFILYNHMYKVTLDGHKVDTVIGPHSLVQLNNLKKGHHTVKVVYSNIKLNIMKIISYVLCATGLVLLIKPDWITRLKKS